MREIFKPGMVMLQSRAWRHAMPAAAAFAVGLSPALLHAQPLSEVLLRGGNPVALTEPLTRNFDPLVAGQNAMGLNGVVWMVPADPAAPISAVPVPTPAGFRAGYVTNVLEGGAPLVVTGYGFGGPNGTEPAIYAGPPSQPWTATLLPRYTPQTFSNFDHAEGAGLYPDADIPGNQIVLVAGSEAVPVKKCCSLHATYWTLKVNPQTGLLLPPSAPTPLGGLDNEKPNPKNAGHALGIAAGPIGGDPPVIFGQVYNATGTRQLPVMWSLAGVGSTTRPPTVPMELLSAAQQSVMGLAAPYNGIMPNQVTDAHVKAAAWCTNAILCIGARFNQLLLVGSLDYMPAGTRVVRHLGVVWIYSLPAGTVTALPAIPPAAGIAGGALTQMNNELELTGIAFDGFAVGEQVQRSPSAGAGILVDVAIAAPAPVLINTMLRPGQTYSLVAGAAAINSLGQILAPVKNTYRSSGAPALLTP